MSIILHIVSFSKTTPSAVFKTKDYPEIIKTIVNKLGEPIDSYWNGSHTWFTTYRDFDFEWRLHPVAGFKMPEASRPEDLFDLALEGEVEIDHYWEGLEIFDINDEPGSIEILKDHIKSVLDKEPPHCGYVDHETIGNDFERTGGDISIVRLLINQLTHEK